MRCDQFFGLNVWARDLISSQSKRCTEYSIRVYEDGTVERLPEKNLAINQVKTERSGKHLFGMYDVTYDLFKYIFPDGRVFEEVEQITVWSSGPMIFTMLVDENGQPVKESMWDEDEISTY